MRTATRVLLPLSVVLALVLVSQGVVQTLGGSADAGTQRRKLEPDPARPRYFLTEARMGYRFEPGATGS
jgi:K+-transporting ATPase A subunit